MEGWKFAGCNRQLLVPIPIIVMCIVGITTGQTTSNPFLHREVFSVGNNGLYVLEWFADWDEKLITFNITAQTTGYVGLGLSKRGKMNGADIVMGGVLPSGRPYFSDRHAIGNQVPLEDHRNDYTLHSAWENGTHTFLSFSRKFDTCDIHDLPLTDHLTSLLWAFGPNDDITQYHFDNRGNYNVYLLDPDLTPAIIKDTVGSRYSNLSTRNLDLGDWKVWSIDISQRIPEQDTAYICTFHKVPRHPTKRHIVGFRSVIGERERRFIHHFLLHKCYPPRNVDANSFFSLFVDKPGELCYLLDQPSKVPVQYCREVNHAWAVGSPALYMVPHVGLPMNDEPDEYVSKAMDESTSSHKPSSMLKGLCDCLKCPANCELLWKMHYDNPDLLPEINLNFSLEVFYTEKLREHDGGLIYTGAATPGAPSMIIPSNELHHVAYGHCGEGCTRQMLPESGIHVYATILHTHLAGTSVRVHHFRGNKELEWILHDDNYDFNFQPIRTLREERLILPGDIIIDECRTQTTDRNGSTTVGGFSTRNEMCNVFIWYYPYIREQTYGVCSSDIKSEVYRDFLGVEEQSWSDQRREFIVTSPPENAGLTISEATTKIDWTTEKRIQLQEYQNVLPQITMCPVLKEDQNNNISLAPDSSIPSRTRTPEEVFDDPLSISTAEKEILRPEHEYVSIYPRNVVPYQPSRECIII